MTISIKYTINTHSKMLENTHNCIYWRKPNE